MVTPSSLHLNALSTLDEIRASLKFLDFFQGTPCKVGPYGIWQNFCGSEGATVSSQYIFNGLFELIGKNRFFGSIMCLTIEPSFLSPGRHIIILLAPTRVSERCPFGKPLIHPKKLVDRTASQKQSAKRATYWKWKAES